MLRGGEPRRSAVVGAIARELSVDNRRDHDPNVPIRKPSCRPSINSSERLDRFRTNGRERAPRRRRRHRPDRSMVHPPDPPAPATLPPSHPATSTAAGDAAPRRPTVAATARERLTHARAQSPRHQMPWRRSPDRDAARFVSRGTSQAALAYNDVRSQRCTGATAAKCLATKSTNADVSRTAGGLPSQPACSPPCRSSAARG